MLAVETYTEMVLLRGKKSLTTDLRACFLERQQALFSPFFGCFLDKHFGELMIKSDNAM